MKPLKARIKTSLRTNGPVQSEPFTLRHMGDGMRGKSVVIPLPHNRALRFGGWFQVWCHIGPRRYTIIAEPGFVESWERMGLGTVDDLRETGVLIRGEMSSVEDSDEE